MIFDQQNMFFDGTTMAASTDSNVIANVGGGDAHDPLFLVVHASTAIAGTCTIAVETADDEGMSTNKATLATYSLPAAKKGLLLVAKLPYGMKKFVRLHEAGATAGKVTAGLTATAPNWP